MFCSILVEPAIDVQGNGTMGWWVAARLSHHDPVVRNRVNT
ncbi:hypothetical protein BSU04_20900 [Caballeronia sordidicola]|uniref:Uncharacterized protein n=1 Tax=Caballeronia sordidicola TaxID=196367 RepID=A0A226WZ58_CABSO|nr:hypothetical protein BSU04_20900 [Caballeronia sordidicola]